MNTTPAQGQRLQSLDALRGFDMFFIMGGDALFLSLAALFPETFLRSVGMQMRHVPWDGFVFIDLVFPLFLFLAGVSFPFSLARQRASGKTESAIRRKIIRRGLTLVALGVVYNGLLQFDFGSLRYASVLGRIGLAWMLAALLTLRTGIRTRAAVCVAILVGYALLSALVAAPDAAGAAALSPEGNLAGYIDRLLLPGRLHNVTRDPEGLLSTLPAVVTALAGIFTGEFVRSAAIAGHRKSLVMATAGILLTAAALAADTVLPINKNLWSSSFVLLTGGLSLLLFALFYEVVDVCGLRRWSFFFRVIGLNSITIYLAQEFIRFSYTGQALFGGVVSLFPEAARPVASNVAYIAVCWLFLYALYRQRIFLKV